MELGGGNIMHKVYEMRVNRLSQDVKKEVEKNMMEELEEGIKKDLRRYQMLWNLTILGEILIFGYLLYISVIKF